MRSVRLGPDLEDRIERAAAVKGETVSEFLRRAAADRVAAVLDESEAVHWDDVLGVVHGGGGRARRTGDAFREALVEDSIRA